MRKLVSVLLAVIFIVTLTVPFSVVCAAEKEQYLFDYTQIEDDFGESTYSDFFDADRDISIYFLEYSYYAQSSSDFALYVYVYNPIGIKFDAKSDNNRLQFSVQYDEEDKPINFGKYGLIYCSQSDDGKITKYRVDCNVYDQLFYVSRKYFVSSIELDTKSGIKDYTVARRYTFTGHAKGNGFEESTLKSTVDSFETIWFDTYHTNYRVQSSGIGEYYDIQSVWFNIDDTYAGKYGNIDSLKAMWIERLTTPILVLDKSSRVDKFEDILCENVTSSFPYAVLWEGINTGESMLWKYHFNYSSMEWDQKNHWPITDSDVFDGAIKAVEVPKFNYCFYSKDVSNAEETVVSSQKLMEYLDSKDWEDSLFETEDRTNYDNPVTFNAKDVNVLQSYQVNSFWKQLLTFGICGPTEEADAVPYKAIQLVDSSDKNISANEFAEKYKVGVAEADDIQAGMSEDKDTYILAYSVTPYYAWGNDDVAIIGESCIVNSLNSDKWNNMNDDQFHGMVAKTTAIQNFDIIEVTFYKNGEYTTLAVVHDPTSYVSSVTVPTTPNNNKCGCGENCWFCDGECEECRCWIKYAILILSVVLFLIIFAPVLPYILRLFISLITLLIRILLFPFKALSKAIKKRKHKDINDENRKE